MKIIRVQYTVKPEYVETNKMNIEAVMKDVRGLNHPGLKYATFLSPDGVSFMHLAFMQDQEANDTLTHLPSFMYFTSELRAKGIDTPPKTEHLDLVAAGYDLI